MYLKAAAEIIANTNFKYVEKFVMMKMPC
jgi:hypothetical protein